MPFVTSIDPFLQHGTCQADRIGQKPPRSDDYITNSCSCTYQLYSNSNELSNFVPVQTCTMIYRLVVLDFIKGHYAECNRLTVMHLWNYFSGFYSA